MIILVTFSINQEQLAYLIDTQRLNLLMTAVEDENHEIAKELLRFPFDINHKTAAGHTAADIALQMKDQDMLLLLLEANSTYPKGFDLKLCSEDIESLTEISEDMHAAIRSNRQVEVQKILRKYPRMRYFYNGFNVSAAATAIKKKKGLIYNLLLNNGCIIGPLEDFNRLMTYLTNLYPKEQDDLEPPAAKKAKLGLETIHAKNYKKPPERHIMKHLASLFYGHDELHPDQRMQHVREVFETLDTIPELSLTLKITATNKNIKNHFDFNHDSVQYMLPTTSDDACGLHNTVGHIYVAAKRFLKEADKAETIATTGHEHSHCAINMTFGNDAKPYAVGDRLNEKRFNDIVAECRQLWEKNKNTMEPIVAWVFERYDEELWPAELIVRVPHMLAHYHGNVRKLTELKDTFKSLFEYYRDVVVPAMKNALSVLEKLSEDSDKFSGLTKPLKASILHSQVELQGEQVELKKIADEKVLELLTPQQIREILEGKKMIIGKKQEKMSEEFYAVRQFIGSEFKNDDIWRRSWNSKFYQLTTDAKAAARDFDWILADAREYRLFMLSDHAGAGKSTTMRHLEIKIKNKLPDHWVSYIDLKQHVKVYEEFENRAMDVGSIRDILLQILSLPADGLESAVFTHLFNVGRVVLLLDGMDEIAPTYKEFFIRLITNIKAQTRNQQWIATRPHHTKELKQKLEHHAHKLLVFNDDQAKHFIRGFLKFKGYPKNENDEDERRHVQQLLQFCFDVAQKLKLTQNPLMLTMVAELHAAGTLPIENFNRHLIYQAMVKHKIKIRADKGVVVNMDADNISLVNIWEVFRIYAMKLFFSDGKITITNNKLNEGSNEFIELSQFELFRKWQKEKSKWTADAISRGGLLIVDNFGTEDEFPDFNHRTFAEFFAAEFIIETVNQAVEDGDNMSAKEFEVRMELAINFVNRYLSRLHSSFDEILRFISDFVSSKMNGLVLSKRFSEFLKQEKTQKIIQYTLLETGNDQLKKSSLILSFIRLSKFDQNFFNAVMMVKDGRSKLFQNAIQYSLVVFYIGLFDIFKRSGIENWHRLTGFGLNLSEKQLKLPNEEELEKLVAVEVLKCEKLVENLKRESLISKHLGEDLARDIKLYYQFLCFVAIIDDISDIADLVKLLRGFANDEYLFALTLTCSSIAEKLFEIGQKHFQHHKDDFSDLLRVFGQTFVKEFVRLDINIGLEIVASVDHFYTKVGEFFKSDDPKSRELIRCALTDIDGEIFSFAILTRSDSLSNLIQISFDLNKLKDKIMEKFIQNMDKYENQRAKIVEDFNVFCAKTLISPTVFELVFRHCSDLDVILKMIGKYKVASGYKTKISNNHPDYSQFFCFFHEHEIPLKHLEEFLQNNLAQILGFVLVSNNNIVDQVIYTLNLIKNSEKFVEIIKRGLGRIEIDMQKVTTTLVMQVFEYFCKMLNELVGGEKFYMDEVLKIIREYESSYLLFFAINHDWQNLLNIFLEQISVDKIVKMLLNSFKKIFSCSLLTPEGFEIFLGKIFSDRHFASVSNDLIRITSVESDEQFELESKRFRIIFNFLNLITQAETRLTDLEKLFNENFQSILFLAYRSRLLTEKVFEIFEKNFCQNKTRMIEWIRRGISDSFFHYFKGNVKSFTPECRSCINYFWTKLEKFFDSDRKLMRQSLIFENCQIHPLILSIYYDIESLKSVYLKHFETHELLCIFANNLTFVFENYDTTKFENFFHHKFFIDQSKRRELITFKDTLKRTIFDIIEIHANKMRNNAERENAKKFKNLLQEIASENGNII
jgi:ankyrin repeat protein